MFNNKIYLADTWWFGMTQRCPINVFEQLAKDRSSKGFTAIQLVIGVPPEIPFFSPDACNSGGHPFDSSYGLNMNYFKEVDMKMNILRQYSLTPCIYGSWGPHIDIAGTKALLELWKEIIDRYHSYSVVWCVCGEADLPVLPSTTISSLKYKTKLHIPSLYNFAKKIYSNTIGANREHNKSTKRLSKWSNIAEFIYKYDPSHNPITIHTHAPMRSAVIFNNPNWLTIDSIQTGHSRESKELISRSPLEAFRQHKHFINLEPWYENILNDFGPAFQRYAFWVSLLSGAIGHSYGAHGIWNMANRDNFMSHWGESYWKEAINYDGARHIGEARKFLDALEIKLPLKPIKNTNKIESYFACHNDRFIGYIPQHYKNQSISLPESYIYNTIKAYSPVTLKQLSVTVDNNLIRIPSNTCEDVVITAKFDTISE